MEEKKEGSGLLHPSLHFLRCHGNGRAADEPHKMQKNDKGAQQKVKRYEKKTDLNVYVYANISLCKYVFTYIHL